MHSYLDFMALGLTIYAIVVASLIAIGGSLYAPLCFIDGDDKGFRNSLLATLLGGLALVFLAPALHLQAASW